MLKWNNTKLSLLLLQDMNYIGQQLSFFLLTLLLKMQILDEETYIGNGFEWVLLL